MKILFDTNILVHAYNKSSVNQKKASTIVKKALRGEIDAYLTPQVLYEFFAIVTNPKRVEYPLPVKEAVELCIDLWGCGEIEKINPSSFASMEVFELVKVQKLSGGKVFDCVLAVTAKENGIDTIYTENVKDFKNYGFIAALNPLV